MSAPVIEVWRLTPAEAELFRDIRLEGLRQDPDAFSSTFEDESREPLSYFVVRLTNSAVFGAFRRGELLGVAGFYRQSGPKHAHKGMLWGMYVRPAARRLGLALRLLDAVIVHASREVEILELSVIAENPAARALYARVGFAEYGVERRAAKYLGRYHDDVLMAKFLHLPPEQRER